MKSAATQSYDPFLDEPVLMYRKEDGELVAMDNRCAHRLAPLSAGQLVGDNIQCHYHGLQYDPSGACVKLPIGGLVPPRAKLRVYPIAERHGLLWIWMGDPAYADIHEIADFSYLAGLVLSRVTHSGGWYYQ